MFMKYYDKLYMSKKLVPKRDDILKKLELGKWQLNIYLIVLARKSANQLEFYSSTMLLQEAYDKSNLLVVGIADGYDEAVKLVRQITDEVYQETGGTEIRDYLLNKQHEFENGNV